VDEDTQYDEQLLFRFVVWFCFICAGVAFAGLLGAFH
jgi:hypothetical protein